MNNNFTSKLTSYEWQRAILDSDLPSTTKLVLLALSAYVNTKTGLAFPSIRTLMKDASLSSEAVVKHLSDAKKARWIEIGNHGYQDQRWARKSYRPRIPVNLKEGVSIEREGVSIHRQGVSIEPPFQEAEIAPEPAPALACSDSRAAPNYRVTIEEQERGEVSPLNPSLSPSDFSSSSMEELPEAEGNAEAVKAQSTGLVDPILPVESSPKSGDSPTKGKEPQRRSNGAGESLPTDWALSADDIKAAIRISGWTEAKVKWVASKFRDHYLSEGTLSHDWQAKWRLWAKHEIEHVRASGKAPERKRSLPTFIQASQGQSPIDREAGGRRWLRSGARSDQQI